MFQYIDISSVDVVSGQVATPQELEGAEAPSRARKVVRAFDLLISTCRPTRGAIAVVPRRLHNQIASTGFSIVRARPGINPFYLHYALRLPSSLEQFRKWSTGSSYPAILDDDVAKTLIPIPGEDEQDRIARLVVEALFQRERAVRRADSDWRAALDAITSQLSEQPRQANNDADEVSEMPPCTIADIQDIISGLPIIDTEIPDRQRQLPLVTPD